MSENIVGALQLFSSVVTIKAASQNVFESTQMIYS